ncbi:hypothetical protein ACFO0A_08160 [Novosphingobium tardum]|uniref:Lipoprotein n=1 Tax=Novosphingobium tardum TaxID=1538021 RepID=A0ABV8RQ35_9SPHN
MIRRKLALLAAAFAGCLALAGCLISPGKFTSRLDLHRDGAFAFSYSGEIYLLALSKLATAGMTKDKPVFKAECVDEENFKPRPCSDEETADQRKTWDANASSREAETRRNSEAMRAMLGGIDPADPAAADELAARLRKQKGWRSVVNKGDGLFLVDYAIEGRLDHDFAFPAMERMQYANPFVAISLHQDGTVRVDAPAFSAASSTGNPFAALAQMGALDKAGENGAGMPKMPQLDGRFTIVTDGEILANNTDEGPSAETSGKRLDWTITPRTAAAPTALVKLQR